jgi:hypothetical protein
MYVDLSGVKVIPKTDGASTKSCHQSTDSD